MVVSQDALGKATTIAALAGADSCLRLRLRLRRTLVLDGTSLSAHIGGLRVRRVVCGMWVKKCNGSVADVLTDRLMRGKL